MFYAPTQLNYINTIQTLCVYYTYHIYGYVSTRYTFDNMLYKSQSVPHRRGARLNRKMLGQVLYFSTDRSSAILLQTRIHDRNENHTTAPDILYIK